MVIYFVITFVSVSCGESTNLKEKRKRRNPMSVFEHAKLQNTMIILLNLRLIFAESNIFANLANGFGRDVKERGNVLQVKVLHDARATLHEQVVTFAGSRAEEVKVASTSLTEQMLSDDATQFHSLATLTEPCQQLFTTHTDMRVGAIASIVVIAGRPSRQAG